MKICKYERVLSLVSVIIGFGLMIGCESKNNPTAKSNTTNPETKPPVENVSKVDTPVSIEPNVFNEFTADNRDFTFVLFDRIQRVTDQNENVFLSPYSISFALGMTYAGAEGLTEEQISEVLRFRLPEEKLYPAFQELNKKVDARNKKSPSNDGSVELNVANRLWAHQYYDFKESYQETVTKYFDSTIEQIDFVNNYGKALEDINLWVKKRTSGRIPNLLQSGSLDSRTRLVLVNAIYFDGDWESPFKEDRTTATSFRRADGSTVSVSMMKKRDQFGFRKNDHTVGVSIPYADEQISMVALMPSDKDQSFQKWVSRIHRKRFDRFLSQMKDTEIRLHFPKFSSKRKYDLKSLFKKMGLKRAFVPEQANFSGMASISEERPLSISDIIHKADIEVDEQGSEAASSTGVTMGVTSIEPSRTKVRFDRPFLYFLYDHPTNTILFIGVLTDPN